MDLTARQVRWLGIASFLVLVLGTPLSTAYALDYAIVEPENPPVSDPPAVPYGELSPEAQAAVDAALSGDSPWYRTRAEMPFDRMPILVVKGDEAYPLVVSQGFHWGAWYGKIPLLTALAGMIGSGYVLRERMGDRGAVPIST